MIMTSLGTLTCNCMDEGQVLDSTTVLYYLLSLAKPGAHFNLTQDERFLEKYIGSNMVQVKTVTGRFDTS